MNMTPQEHLERAEALLEDLEAGKSRWSAEIAIRLSVAHMTLAGLEHAVPVLGHASRILDDEYRLELGG
jgi:hypothetical protein